jgi:micrococcal nuclease
MRYLGALAVVLALWTGPVLAGCKVARVLDGDTLTLLCGAQMLRVRLLGYDTPEVTRPRCAAERAAGQLATVRLRRLVAAGEVTQVRFAGHDRYGRDLAEVEIAGRDVAAHMLASSLALPYGGKRRPNWCDRLAAAQ